MIELNHLSKMYGNVCGINDFHLTLSQGAHGLIGPNGSGKSTLIHLVTGNLKPSLGKIRVFDADPWGQREVRRRIGLCPASDLLLPNATAYQWVFYLAKLSGLSGGEADQKTKARLSQLGMKDAMHRPIGTYSLGMRQRTKLAQALVHDPDLLVLDEPFNGLDPIARHDLSELLIDWRRSGKSLLIASHVLHELDAVIDSFLLLREGRLLMSGPSRQLPTSIFEGERHVLIQGPRLRTIASLLAEQPWIGELRFVSADTELEIVTHDAGKLYDELRRLGQNEATAIHRVTSPDNQLAAAFASLTSNRNGYSQHDR